MTRAEKVAEAQRLRATGLVVRAIAARMGVSHSTAGAWLSDPDLAKQRERRKRYGGICIDCGSATDGSLGREKAPERCAPCWAAFQGTAEYKASVTYWTRERVIAAIREWATIHGEPPAMADWNSYTARHAYHDTARAERFERQYGRWPWSVYVSSRFGWNAIIREAGFTPRDGKNTPATLARRRDQRQRAAA